ncbi:hypothetical protein [Streptomyces sp. NPDC001165]|uniref:hypothetical protein n=1 Tax=Streptomyces sp. NPDC001165 TaxID=3364546 RepID=UPI003680E2CD
MDHRDPCRTGTAAAGRRSRRVGERVALGLWLAELAQRQGEPRDLDAAIAAIDQALADDPGHHDAREWQGILGQLHWARYEATYESSTPPDQLAALLVEPIR